MTLADISSRGDTPRTASGSPRRTSVARIGSRPEVPLRSGRTGLRPRRRASNRGLGRRHRIIGFVGLTLAATYLHLVPTVLGARVVSDRLAVVGIGGLGVNVAGVGLGFSVESDVVARLGATSALVAAAAVPAMAVRAARQPDRGRWTTELAWHEFTTASLVASTVWFALGVGTAAVGALLNGASPAAWSLASSGVPLVVGGVLEALVASATHLVPTLRGASPGTRARLGRAALPRVIAWQIGTAGSWASVGLSLAAPVPAVSAAVLGLAVAAALVTLASAFQRDPERSTVSPPRKPRRSRSRTRPRRAGPRHRPRPGDGSDDPASGAPRRADQSARRR